MNPNLVTFARSPCRARGFRSRTAALLATVAICACTAVRLDAVVIDDFENGVRFAEGGGGTNYFVWGLTNGQLVVYTNTPIPTPSNELMTYDNVYWPNSLPGVSLEGGRTLELRMDLNHTSADDLFLLLGSGAPGTGKESGYAVIVDRNEVALMKYGSVGITIFYWDSLATTNENVTVKLGFAKTNSSLAITVKVVDKGNQRVPLYERTFVDGPGADGPVPPPDPHGTDMWTSDFVAPYTTFSFVWAGVWQIIRTSPPPLEMLLDNLEYDVYHPPHLEIAQATNGVDLTWQLPKEEHIVVAADQLAGPWWPCPQPHARLGDAFCLTMSCQSQQKFFKLVPGRQFTDDFSSVAPSWMPWFYDPPFEQWVVTNGVLRLSAVQSPDYGFLLMPLGTNVEAHLRDFYTAVDILDWATSTTNWTYLSLWGRGVLYSPTWGNGYFGVLTKNPGGSAGTAALRIWDGDGMVEGPSFDCVTNPPPYRLEFSGVGNDLRVRVLNGTTKALIAEQSLSSTKFAEGLVGIWVNTRNGPGDTFTITADNYFVTGTRP